LADPQALIGKSFGTYTLQKMIGKGRISAVFLTEQTETQPPVALKILLPVASRSPVERAAFLERFRQKMGVLVAMHHPNILPISDYDESDGFPYLTMPSISNGTLRNVMEQEGQLPLTQIADYLDQLASALDYAHAQAIFHRDITPTNMLLADDGQLLLADFGLTDIVLERSISQLRLLKAGLFIGSPSYMAPEQIMGDSAEAQADIYALGVVLFQMVTGSLPFQGATPLEIAAQQVKTSPPAPCSLREDLTPAAEQVILRMLAKRPAERFSHAQEAAHAFRVALTATMDLPQEVQAEMDASEKSREEAEGSRQEDELTYPLPGYEPSAFSRLPEPYIQEKEPQSQSIVSNGTQTKRLRTFKATRVLPAASMLSPASKSAPMTKDDENLNHAAPINALSIGDSPDQTPLEIDLPSNTAVEQAPPPENISPIGVLDIPNTEQTTEGTMKLTGAVKIVQVPVAGQPGRYVTGLLPVMPETEQPEAASANTAALAASAERPSSLGFEAKRLAQRATALPKRQKIAALSLILLLLIVGSGLLAFAHSRSNSSSPVASKLSTKQHAPDMQATLATQATATVQANNILSDSLSQNIHDWPISKSGSQQFFFADGAYHVVDDDSKQSAPSILPGIVLKQPLTYRLSMEEIKGNETSINNSFGMILFFTSHTSASHPVTTFYSFEVVNIKGGQYQFWKYDSNNSSSPWTSLWHHTFGSEFHQGDGSKNINMFVVSVNNSVFTFTVNGKIVGSVKDRSFTNGQVGMLVNLKGTEVAFSNLSLTYQ
jgi:serine/threonine protein kinase